MNHLIIKQNTTIENVNSNIIEKLATVVKAGLLDETSVLEGNLYTAGCYEEDYNILTQKYPNLNIITNKKYFKFQDSEVERISTPIWGDGTGTSRTMAAKSITFSSNNLPFQGNTAIEYFNEFELFENTLYLKGSFNELGFFEGCTNLKEIRLPLNIVNTATSSTSPDAGRMFLGCTNLKKVYFPEGSLYVRGGMFENCQRLILDNLPDTITDCAAPRSSFIFFFRVPLGCTYAPNPQACMIPHFILQRNTTQLGSSFIHQCDVKYMYCMATVPPTLGSWSDRPYRALYVPIGSGDLYKNATNWSAVANITYEYDFNKLLDTTRGTDLSFLLEKGKVDVPIYSFTGDKITSVSNDTSIVEVDSNTLIPKKVGTTSVKFTCGNIELTKNVTIYDNYVDAIASGYTYYKENRVKFNTGVVPTTNTKIEFSCAPLESDQTLFGCQNTDNTGKFTVSYGTWPYSNLYQSFYDSTYTGVTGGTIGQDTLITLTPTTCTIGGTTKTYTRTTYPTTPIWIFDYADNGNYSSNINFHYMKIYEGETLIHHYVPLKSGDMYDIIENKLLNALW